MSLVTLFQPKVFLFGKPPGINCEQPVAHMAKGSKVLNVYLHTYIWGS